MVKGVCETWPTIATSQRFVYKANSCTVGTEKPEAASTLTHCFSELYSKRKKKFSGSTHLLHGARCRPESHCWPVMMSASHSPSQKPCVLMHQIMDHKIDLTVFHTIVSRVRRDDEFSLKHLEKCPVHNRQSVRCLVVLL